jgi:hypothetical protein
LTVPIGSLIVRIGADISGIQRNSARGAQALGGMERRARGLGIAIKAIAFGLVARKITSMVKESMAAIDAQAKLSRQLGGTIDSLQGLQLAASEAGVSSGALVKASEMLNRRLGEAARKGAGEAYDALRRLDLSARDLSRMDLDERMATISDAMVSAGMSTQEMADTLGQLGIRQGEFTRLMIDGGAAIRNARTAIDKMGLSLSEVDAAKVEAANDAMGRVKLASKAIARQLTVALSPVLTAIANQFVDAAADSGELKNSVQKVVEVGIKGFGLVGNVMRGVHLVLKTLELAGWAWATAYVEIFRAVAKVVSFFVDLGIGKVNELIEALNQIPGVDVTPVALTRDSKFMKGLDDLSENMRATTADVFNQLRALATEEWPSEKAEKFFREVQAAAQDAAIKVTESRRQLQEFGGAGEGASEQAQKEAQALRDRLASQLEILREHAMTETELENARFSERLTQLGAALDAELITRQEFNSISEGIERKHMEAMARIRKKGMERVQTVSVMSMASGVKQITGMLMGLTSSMARENRTMFDLHKAFAIADAAVSGAMGVAKTIGAYPFPINLGFAAAHAAMAAGQIAMIAAKQFEGGSRSVMAPAPAATSSGGRGGGPATGQGAAGGITGGGAQAVSLSLEGEFFSRSSVLGLIDQINEAVADGAVITVAP